MAQKRSCSGECRGHRREYCPVLLQIQRISSVKSVREVQTPSGKNASISECTPELTNPRRGSVRKGGRRVESGAAWAGTQKCHRVLPGQRKEPICHVLHRIRRDRPQSAGSLH